MGGGGFVHYICWSIQMLKMTSHRIRNNSGSNPANQQVHENMR